MCTPRAGNSPFPIPGGAAKCPIREFKEESPQAPANETAMQGARQRRQPPVFRKKSTVRSHPARARTTVHFRPISEHPIHAVSGYTQRPGDRLANPRPLLDES